MESERQMEYYGAVIATYLTERDLEILKSKKLFVTAAYMLCY